MTSNPSPKNFRYLKLAGLASASLLLTPFLLGGAFFRALLRQAHWGLGLVFALVFSVVLGLTEPFLGVLVAALYIMVATQIFAESKGVSFLRASTLSLSLGLLVWGIATQGILLSLGESWLSQSMAFSEFMKGQLIKAAGENVAVTAEQIQAQLPGSLVSLFILFFGFAIGLERKAHHLFKLPFERFAGQLRPLDFKVPDFFLWVVLFGILFSIFDQVRWLQIVGENVITVGLAIYFFQGLAILEVFLLFLRVHPFLKFFTYFTLVGQLLLVISALGFVDFWLDLRKKMRNSLQRT